MVHGGRAGLILSIPAQEVSLGSPRVGTIHVQAPTPNAPPHPAYFGQSLSIATHLSMNYLAMASRALGGSKRRRMRRRGPPDLRPIPEGVCEPIYIRKK